LSEPSTAPSAFSLWCWLGERATAKVSAQQQADALRDHAHELMSMDPQFANELRGQADLLEKRRG
ncbi:MAG TPA: hypothetical protein VLJ62_16450, partial [Burkholderiaceae bacterium]|nr:hypothetical protein [Burkholderiaceae bacterium]